MLKRHFGRKIGFPCSPACKNSSMKFHGPEAESVDGSISGNQSLGKGRQRFMGGAHDKPGF